MVEQTENKQFFQASVTWLNDKRGLLTSSEAGSSIPVEMPAVNAGKGKPWTPQNLLLGAISSCFMTTYLHYAEKLKVNLEGFSCRLSGTVEMAHSRYRLTKIDLFTDIFIRDAVQEKLAQEALQKTQRHCLIINSITAEVHYHNHIKVVNELQDA